MNSNNTISRKKDRLLEIVRFGISGVISTLSLYVSYILLLNWLDARISYSIAYLFAFVINYLLTTLFTFKVKKSIKNIIGFIASNIINYFISIIFLYIFLKIGLNKQVAPIPTLILAAISNYFIVRIVMLKYK